jgi:hypothetical protein
MPRTLPRTSLARTAYVGLGLLWGGCLAVVGLWLALDVSARWPGAGKMAVPVGIGLIGVGQFVLAVAAEGAIRGASRKVVGAAELGAWGVVAVAVGWAATGAWL